MADCCGWLSWCTVSWTVLAFLVYRLVKLFRADADLTVYSKASNVAEIQKRLSGKVVWVTGASSGIGEYLAYELSQHGAKVILSARRKDELERVKKNLRGEYAKETLVLPLDILNFDSHKKAVEDVVKKFGRIDVLVNNAGRSQRGLCESTDFQVDRDLFELNVLGTISLTKAALPQFLEQGSGNITTVSSVAGKMGAPVSGTYAATKHALQGYFDTLRAEVSDRGINITLVCPGPVISKGAANSFSQTAGVKTGEFKVDDSKKMKTERCARLMAAGIAFNLGEIWISTHPILLFCYLSQYSPDFARALMPAVGGGRVRAFKSGNNDINHSFFKNFMQNLRGKQE